MSHIESTQKENIWQQHLTRMQGKTTLTEKLLLFGGAIQEAGAL